MSDLDSRVTKLEYRVDGHDKEISKVNSDNETLKLGLLDIRLTLTQIKWAIIGALAVWAFQALDIKDLIKLAFSVLL